MENLCFHLSGFNPPFDSELNRYCKYCTVKDACVKLPINDNIQSQYIKLHGIKKQNRRVCINCAFALIQNNVYKIEFGKLVFNEK